MSLSCSHRSDRLTSFSSNRTTRMELLMRDAAEQQLQNSRQEAQNLKLLNTALHRRDIEERKAVLNLTQMALSNCDLDLGITELDKLINALEVSLIVQSVVGSILIKARPKRQLR